MVAYINGYIPDNLLITFNAGYSAGEGQWKHQLSAGTYAKHLALVTLARRNTGRTLALSAGWSGYRPFAAQVYARKVHGRGAAEPGKSSHGGFWERQQTLAIDYGNWSYVYNGDRAAFYRDARAVGFEPGLISPQRGYPDEPWHLVDKEPWRRVSAPAGGGVPAPATKPQEDDDMLMLKITGIGTAMHYVALGPEIFGHFTGDEPYEMVMQISRIQDDWQVIPASALPAMLEKHGCDRNIWDWRNGQFVVLDPLTGTVKPGNTWTASKAIRAAIAGIKPPTLDPSPIVAAVSNALTAGIEKGEEGLAAAVREAVSAGIDLDEQALAAAVNDERDRRERERLAR